MLSGRLRLGTFTLVDVAERQQVDVDRAQLFVRNGEQIAPVAMLGLRDGENLFIDDAGKWLGEYVPAYVRRYPFVFSETPEGQALLSMDSAYPGLDKSGGDTAPRRLFDAAGNETDFLKETLTFLEQFQAGYLRTMQFSAELKTKSSCIGSAGHTRSPEEKSIVCGMGYS